MIPDDFRSSYANETDNSIIVIHGVRVNGFRKERSCPFEIERDFEEERRWEIGRIFIRNG